MDANLQHSEASNLQTRGAIVMVKSQAANWENIEDLTESEARVLTEYGWTPNTGLGTMLNYCDRVVHDRKNERDSSEWRSKIAKLLMNGYNGGTIVTTDIPKKVMEYNGGQDPQIKLEL
ncbi:hypothetical protein Acr_09g0005680 [Actinidia rufa]|uniref:Uncharacterized protein n=1 Tax=Actinidia rufa TaxID=165716 RepID=A0A7J0F679_9ERIC|nr:hypothetical protein Acr_09g0005590 [Actinidia rufa]GFY94122.1 hypothetical protein Acr_09g0005680 [Actinidia rufa]